MIRVEYDCIPLDVVNEALRVINLDLFSASYEPETLKKWAEDHHWLPHLWKHPSILHLSDHLPEEWRGGQQSPAQIVIQPPYHGPNPHPFWHIDEGDWLRIVGIPLTPWDAHNGTLHLPVIGALSLDPGSAVMMSGDQPHGVGKNLGAHVRYGVYFRWK